jgi:hypothetical protein
MAKIDENRVESQTLDPVFPRLSRPEEALPRRWNTAAVRVGPVAARGWRLGATTGPLNGGALTLGVDARVGEEAGRNAAIFHRAAMGGRLCLCGYRVSRVEGRKVLRVFLGVARETSEEGGSLLRLGPGGAASNRCRRGHQAWGRQRSCR